jgi:hypothetical protein
VKHLVTMAWGPWRPILCALAVAAGCGVKEVPSAPTAGPDPGGPPATGGMPAGPGSGGGPGTAGTAGGGTGGAGGNPPPVPAGGSAGGPVAPPVDAGPGAPPGPSPDAGPAAPTTPRPEGGPFGQGASREQVVVFLHIGHSNMAGRASTPANLRSFFFETAPRLWSFHGTNMIAGTPPFVWRPAREPLSPDAMTEGAAGPGMAMLRAGLAIAAPGVHLVSIGHGQSGMAGGLCASFKKGALFYEVIMGPARRLRGHVTFGGLWTMLGTTERHADTATQRAFSDCLADITAAVRAELGAPEMPLLMSDFEMEATGDTSPDLPYARIIIQELREAQGRIPRSAIIPTEDLGMDGSHHFDLEGHREWGERGVQILEEKGWAPWAAN